MPAPDFQSEPVAHDSVEAIEALAQVGGSKSHVNPGGRPKSKHNLASFQCLYHPTQLCRVKVPAQLDAPALGQYYRHSAWRFSIRWAAPTHYFDSRQPFAIALDIAGLCSSSLESSLQRAQRHCVDPAELAS
jgi:hypothetical protein